ncbi:MAG: DUF1146 domain-containing protein [Acholeplasmatales bacterium]|nr:DUF1146 domain-containing protein [Acholeplasmatales bacterium]
MINVYNLVYTTVFLISALIAYFIVLNSNFERLFKQGKIVAIRIAQVILAIIIAYFITQAIMGLYNATQFTS